MDLISRSELIRYINEHVIGSSDWAREIRQDFIDMVEKQPTAYDENKVIEKLKEHNYYSITVDEAVEIVKGGLEE